MTEVFDVLAKNFLSIHKNRKSWRTHVLNFSTNLSEALVSRKIVTF